MSPSFHIVLSLKQKAWLSVNKQQHGCDRLQCYCTEESVTAPGLADVSVPHVVLCCNQQSSSAPPPHCFIKIYYLCSAVFCKTVGHIFLYRFQLPSNRSNGFDKIHVLRLHAPCKKTTVLSTVARHGNDKEIENGTKAETGT